MASSHDHPRQSSIDLDSADRPFDNIINFRDVASSINDCLGSRVLKEGVLFRSARLDDASERDKRRLTDELHISTVIDLRSSTEHQIATKKRRAENGLPVEQAALPKAEEHLVQLGGVRRELISLTGKAFERSLLWKLDWYNFLKVLALAASGYRPDAVVIVGQQVMSPRGLIGLGQDTLDSSTAEMKELFELFAKEETYPAIVHCTQGKDRTGLMVLLLLLLTGLVPEDAIATDYVKSEPELVLEFEERMKEIRMIGLSEDYTRCPPGFTSEIKAHLDSKYGGVEGYLLSIGIDREKQEMVRRKLLA
ncbi:hypothetical protein ASPWEDRAFT_737692 [Aspergillus wentii DTO 134E9]|uniref:Tyrosine specific protein phosphatases domain-containing protein n=1 Tax=Aspergillus wentii DTO 134E9 TaxID=1073089 RepID=A0A1L9RP81_ASPWE|nr:uncharacterized protein ASPWEDRAFT_737692 [Aspergillus wentii DTO 134E9]KAI9923638.1 hypothetical protein MW887_008458 [Aspergillus wentii]OJJ36746.1 hypothetical protein ASPWEDRAFT_737692 [Aspergillus wentii DTO 134E9]